MTSHFTILPTDILQLLSTSITPDSKQRPLRILRLPHPRLGLPSLFVPQEWLPSTTGSKAKTGMFELQAVCPPDERSWITGEEVVADGKMLTMTPIDPTFLLLPIIRMAQPDDGSAPQFRTSEDLFEAAARKNSAGETESGEKVMREDILHFCSLPCAKQSLSRFCEVKEISPEIVVYRYSSAKLLKYLRAKVSHLEQCTALDESRTLIRNLAKDGLMEDGKEALLKLGRIRLSCDLVSQYLPSDMRDMLVNSYDLAPLSKYIESTIEEAISKAVTAPNTKKGKAQEKEGAAGKKRKSTKASHGVETLKKANTTGMAKLSSFFNKAN